MATIEATCIVHDDGDTAVILDPTVAETAERGSNRESPAGSS